MTEDELCYLYEMAELNGDDIDMYIQFVEIAEEVDAVYYYREEAYKLTGDF